MNRPDQRYNVQAGLPQGSPVSLVEVASSPISFYTIIGHQQAHTRTTITTTLQESPTPDLAQTFRNHPTGRLLRLGLISPLSASLRLLSRASVYVGCRSLPVTRLLGEPYQGAAQGRSTHGYSLSFNKRHLNSAPRPKLQLPSSERVLSAGLAKIKHDKWGFVIYRCTYQDDHA
jgi:hypothetical protein